MSKRSLWRLVTVLAVLFGCGYFFTPLSKVKLGLDLRGGVHFELEVQGQEALVADLADTRDRLVARLRDKGLPGATVSVAGDALRIEGVGSEQSATVEKVAKDFFPGYSFSDDGGGFRMTQRSDYQKQLKDDANKRALEVIEKRIRDIDPANVLEPEITASGAEGNRIVVEIPGIEEGDRERIKKLLATPGTSSSGCSQRRTRSSSPPAKRPWSTSTASSRRGRSCCRRSRTAAPPAARASPR